MVDLNFLLSKWDRLITQANITLNLFRLAQANPKLSAYSYIFGTHNFEAILIALLETKVIAHTHPAKQKS